MKRIIILITILFVLFSTVLLADIGAIIPVETINLDEPAQRAIIAYDGFEEILILQTELKTSEATDVIRFIPLPSLPNVTATTKDIFSELQKLVKKYNLQYVRQTKSFIQSAEKIRIEIKKTIGAHDITVIKANDSLEFVKWVQKFMKSHGYDYNITSNWDYIDIINHYINNDYNYFVFDLVNIKKQNSIQPIMYTFNSKTLYYPLVATNIIKSYGTIELFIFSENGRHYLSSVYGFLPSTTAIVDSKEMSRLSPKIAELLGKHAILQAFKYNGKLFFNKDIDENSGLIIIKAGTNQLMLNTKHDK